MRQTYEVADVINAFYDEAFRMRIPVHHQRTLTALQTCRTAALGGHLDACDACGHVRISYNSCRNRHCPKCQGLQKEMWVIQREEELLPVAYFHVVFTLPHELDGLCLHNPRFMYDLLFDSAWYVLNKFGRDEESLGAQTAATMILHIPLCWCGTGFGDKTYPCIRIFIVSSPMVELLTVEPGKTLEKVTVNFFIQYWR